MAKQGAQNDVPSFSQDFVDRKIYSKSAAVMRSEGKDRGNVLYSRSQDSRSSNTFKLPPGGAAVTKEVAISLRKLLFGGSTYIGNQEWMKSALEFREPGSALGYGLVSLKNNPRAVIMCVQAYILKHLLFNKKDFPQESSRDKDPLRPYKDRQQQALGLALADIIWKAGTENSRCTICLPGDRAHLERELNYTPDGLTEKINLFEFQRKEDTVCFLVKHVHLFQQETGNGVIVLLYSMILSRGIDRVQEDLNGEYTELLTPVCEATQALITFLLAGRATPYLHNGVMHTLDEDNVAGVKEQVGLMSRGEIGALIWNRNDESSKQLGSRLKTPSFPIWVTQAENKYGVLFHTRRDLTRDHRAEHRFDLHYYNGCPANYEPTILTLDTRFNKGQDEYRMPVLERVLVSKWQGAQVSWNETTPYV
ncbi:inactive ubiquitin carboxyl-terminal hydrolase MINDY-4B-like [Limulus polyphemus]|uniref:Ubiquitin carboxyl-terminal hydrolase MINDY n=1 Tax=Limulus polyphemus TaxID=6850 RepID=A0ABM1BDI7_LIMPO|nr:inactive ubiquitin carboxyl-terminal hydrolase MINDY-4B-like [Limulus polyphemus]